jgi:hypothetical protein
MKGTFRIRITEALYGGRWEWSITSTVHNIYITHKATDGYSTKHSAKVSAIRAASALGLAEPVFVQDT